MTRKYELLAGTVGQGVWRSEDGGETFTRSSGGMFMEAEIRALAADPRSPNRIYAGTDGGLFRSEDGGRQWERLETPFDAGKGWQAGTVVWSLLIHPQQPDTLFAGTCPPAIYRSQDGGATWRRLDAALAPECPPIRFSRVTCLLADPEDANAIWAGVEIDGAWRSRDGGETWERRSEGLSSQDIHALAIVPGSPRTLLAATNNDMNLSRDEGASWQPQNVKERFPRAYCRGLLLRPDDPQTVFLGNGDGPPGTMGTLQISRDGGQNWNAADLPAPPNSTIWTFAAHPALPDLIFAASVLGNLYRSEDGGAAWARCRHEFGEVRSLLILPQPSGG